MFTSHCVRCDEVVGHGPECSKCKRKYHFNCGGISERGFNRLGTGRSSWLCSPCRDGNTVDVPCPTPITPQEDCSARPSTPLTGPASPSAQPTVPSFSSGLPLERCSPGPTRELTPSAMPHLAILEEISRKINSLQSQFDIITSIQADLKVVKSDIGELKASLNSRIDDISNRVTNIEAQLSATECTNTEVVELKNSVKSLLDEGCKNEQWVRRSNIQFNGIPQKGSDNLIAIMQNLANLSGFPLDPNIDIDFVTRVAVKNDTEGNKCKPVILKMQSRYKKDNFLASLRRLKIIKASDIGFSGVNDRIYANDHLSARNKYLFHLAKTKANEKNYKYCWVRNCTIMVRRDDSSPIVYINSEEALNKIS